MSSLRSCCCKRLRCSLLDEPTNHLDLPAIEWVESYLRGYGKAFVVVSHDRSFLEGVTDRTVEVWEGDVTPLSWGLCFL